MMKKYIKFAAFVLTGVLLAACGNKQQTEVTTSNNLFSTLLGKSEAEVQARIDSVWTHFFTPGDISKYDADGEKYWYSDPSYCLPAFLDLWAEKADAKNDFWREAADKARWLLEASQDSVTGLYPDYCLFDGKPYRRPNFDYNTDRYQYDAIRCPMNVGMDYYLTGKDASKREQSDARIDSAEREQARPKVKTLVVLIQNGIGVERRMCRKCFLTYS